MSFVVSARAATYYVRTDGNNTQTGLANTSGGAWRTIDWAADHVTAGDVVRVQAGTYVEVASPGVNGTPGNTITLVADGPVTTCGMSFSGRSYIRVIGFSFNPSAGGCSAPGSLVNMSGTNKGLEFWNNDLGPSQGKGYVADFVGSGARCDSCIIFGGSVHDIGNPGSQVALSIAGNDVFVGYVNFANICYVGNGPTGNRHRYINDNFSGFIQCSGSHPDFFYIHGLSSLGYSNSLVESSFGSGTPTSTDNKEFHAENQQATPWNDNVWRFNVAHDLGSGFYSVYTDGSSGASNRWRFYNNSILNCARASTDLYVNGCGGWAFSGSAYIHNTLFYRAWSDASTIGALLPWGGFGSGNTGTITADYNLAFDPGGPVSFLPSWTNQAHEQSNINPQLNNVANSDFTLQSGSGARGKGGPLTTASGSGTNSTSLTVAPNTGSFFIGDNSSNLPQYGGQLVPGDFITVGAATVQVASVSGDVITLASPISWNNGDPVYFGTSATIDIGAYPYKAGGYTLTATYSQSGGVATITPSDPSLVRFVICYQDGIPTAVDPATPYTCPVGNGTFEAKVYPKYASQTLSVTASPSSSPPPQPSEVIDPSRRIDWSQAGVIGGIPRRTTICATIDAATYGNGTTDATTAIQTAMTNCPADQVVYLPAGTYKLTRSLTSNKGIVLRGAGPSATKILLGGNILFSKSPGSGGLGGYATPTFAVNWTAGYSKGSSVITLASTQNLQVGQEITLDQLNDSSIVSVVGNGGTCGVTANSCGRNGAGYDGGNTRAMLQISRVTAINGNQVSIDPPLYYTFQPSLSPGAFFWANGNIKNAGVEDLRIDANANNFAVGFTFCTNCWVKGVRIENIARAAIYFARALHGEVRNSIIAGSQAAGPQNYGIELIQTGQTLVENNAMQNVTAPLLLETSAGNVIAYNYMINNVAGWQFAAINTHLSHNWMNLYEGNAAGAIALDVVWGSGSHQTLFRNRFTGYDPNKNNSRMPVHIQAWNRYSNVVGNVLGTDGFHKRYELSRAVTGGSDDAIYELGYWFNWYDGLSNYDDLTYSTLLRWGNYDYATKAVHWDSNEIPSGEPVPSTHVLPASLYLGAKPSWFGTGVWPPIGPDVTGGVDPSGLAHKIPAQICFEQGKMPECLLETAPSPPGGGGGVSGTTPLADPNLSGIKERTYTTQDEVVIPPVAGASGFNWEVTEAMSNEQRAMSIRKDSSLIAYRSSLPRAPTPTTAPRFNLASQNLTPGRYTLHVQATNSGQTSNWVSASITLVEANLNAVKVYPNPWRADKHTGDIIFSGLSANTTIKIFSVSGHLVRKLPAASGQQMWDLKTDSGDRVASGVYLYVIEDGSNKRKGKLAVVR